MHEETLSYRTVKSINPSERSAGLLPDINHAERQIKPQEDSGGSFSSPRASEIVHICYCPKKTFQRVVFHRSGSLPHDKSRCYFFIFCVGAFITLPLVYGQFRLFVSKTWRPSKCFFCQIHLMSSAFIYFI